MVKCVYAKSGCGLTLNAKDNTIVRSIKVNLVMWACDYDHDK